MKCTNATGDMSPVKERAFAADKLLPLVLLLLRLSAAAYHGYAVC